MNSFFRDRLLAFQLPGTEPARPSIYDDNTNTTALLDNNAGPIENMDNTGDISEDEPVGYQGYPLRLHPVHMLFFLFTGGAFLYVFYKKIKDRQKYLARQRFLNDPEAQARYQEQLKAQEQQYLDQQQQSWLNLIEHNQLSKVLKQNDFKDKPSSSLGLLKPSTTGVASSIPTGENEEAKSSSSSSEGNNSNDNNDDDDGDIDIEIGKNQSNETMTTASTSPKDIIEEPSESEFNNTVIVIPLKKKNQNDGDNNTSLTSSTTTATITTAPNLCAICLDSYDVDDKIVWSNNPECQHVFHHACLLDYYMTMVKKKRSNNSNTNNNTTEQEQQSEKVQTTSCPCCRQDFFIQSSSDTSFSK